MMKTLLALTATFAIIATATLAEERSVNLSVPGMFCASCPFVVQAAIQKVDGVISVATDVDERTALVVYDDALASPEAIAAASTNAGYEATIIEGNT